EPDAETAGVPEFLTGLPTNRAVSHSALVRADQLFTRQRGKAWAGSAERAAPLGRFAEVLTAADAAAVADHLVGEPGAAARLAKIAGNPDQPAAVRRAVLDRAARLDAGARPGFAFGLLADA